MLNVDEVDLSGLSLAELTALRTKVNTVLCGEAGKVVKDSITAFLAKYPEVYAIRWTQYTPYFNDGDSCEFTVHEPYVRFVSQNETDPLEDGDDFGTYDDDWGLCEWSIGYRLKEGHPDALGSEELAHDLKELYQCFSANEDSLEKIFGNHVEVIVRQGQDAEIQDYDHD